MSSYETIAPLVFIPRGTGELLLLREEFIDDCALKGYTSICLGLQHAALVLVRLSLG